MKITSRAVQAGRLYVMPSPGIRAVEHRLEVPVGACPYSNNPLSGWLEIRYAPEALVLEVVALHRYVQWVGGGRDEAPMSAEEIAVRAKHDCEAALGVAVQVRLVLRLNPGRQRLVVEA